MWNEILKATPESPVYFFSEPHRRVLVGHVLRRKPDAVDTGRTTIAVECDNHYKIDEYYFIDNEKVFETSRQAKKEGAEFFRREIKAKRLQMTRLYNELFSITWGNTWLFKKLKRGR